ncbi:MAG: protein-L-isoaspartate(D-aspartate) O-methyltransferase [Acidobacteria bacterium]|nr:MAG: protein-L-isoaspartate(D-aspartate) O-methyltransferase [Acidobacteriota bacterium]REK03123.1 MAG: protein-L-isoaspartate(D-aspartate) O-methyltransferase [Acidobacteriota bacterium]REK15470.1 MAG: protein-L-isoaspartate(D-aspartate) O-methyltransferase [Acidobacteriota bacterium]REK45821.1 MAG: protein-L-isoaspartate(D-aspartate) O-methyltransferase [Acidobacteriota bacterium]
MARDRMIRVLRDEFDVSDERVLGVMASVPRHLFVPEALKFQAYRNNALPISGKQTISQPLIVARMTELLDLEKKHKVLEIGTGSGYQTAILAKLGGKIYSIERVLDLAETAKKRLAGLNNVTIKCSDGTNGWDAYSPFDRILVTAGAPVPPEPLVAQLSNGGKIVIPVGDEKERQNLIRITKTPEGVVRETFGACSFVPLIGDHGWEA